MQVGQPGGEEEMYGANSALVRHLDSLRDRGLRDGTIYKRWRTIMHLRDWLGQDILTVTHDDLTCYLDRELSLEARATAITQLRGFYQWCLLEGLVDADPTIRLIRPRLPRRLPRPMPEDDVALALTAAPTYRIRPAIAFAACAGLRAFDMHSLNRHDLHSFDDPPIIFIPEQKGGDEGTVPLSDELITILAGCDLPDQGPLFVRSDERGGGRLPPHGISQSVNAFLHDLGISHTLHSLRHRFGTQSYQASGRDLRQTQELLRHRSVSSTQIYSYVDPGERSAIVNRLPQIVTQ